MWRCLLEAVSIWPLCCHIGMSCHRHRTWHPTPSHYTDTGPTCRCAIHWCVTPHWNKQLPILMTWVWTNRDTFPQSSTHKANARNILSWCHSMRSSVETIPPQSLEPGTGIWSYRIVKNNFFVKIMQLISCFVGIKVPYLFQLKKKNNHDIWMNFWSVVSEKKF